jgi:hypothetical protein
MSGVGLDTAFNQDEPQQNINTHAKQDKQAEGLEDERKDKKKLNLERIQHAKVGETVSYNATTGTIVRKDGSYVTIYNEGNNAFDQVHAGTTSISTDTIGSGITGQLWDQMRQEQRVASLSKAGVQEPLHFISRKWSELPMNLKDVLKVNPTSRGEPGEKMPGTASNTSERTTITPAGRNIQTGQQGTKLNTGQERTFTPGGKKPEKKVVKEPTTRGQERAHSTGVTNERARGQDIMSRGAQSGLDILTSKKPKDEGVTFASCKSTEYISKLSPSYTSTGSGYKAKPNQPKKEKPAPKASLLASHDAGKKEQHVNNHIATTGAAQAGLDIMTAGKDKPKKDEGVTFASGIEKSNTYGDLATALYRIRNNLNKVKLPTSITSQVKFPKYEEPDDKTQQSPTGTEHDTHNSESGGQIGSKDSFKKSDVEHGAYGGVVTDTPIDATEDYEEERDDIVGQEFDHNHQQKTPKDFGVPQAKDTKKEGDGGSVTTGTPGTVNPVNSGKKQPGAYDPKHDPDEDGYRGKAIVNKSNTRYGARQVTKEEADEFLEKKGIKPSKPKTNFTDPGGDYVEETEGGPHGGRDSDFAED